MRALSCESGESIRNPKGVEGGERRKRRGRGRGGVLNKGKRISWVIERVCRGNGVFASTFRKIK